MSGFAGKHVLIIIENLPAPFDRRVWQEACTLKEKGAYVSIICPKMKGYTESFEKISGIDIYRHPLPVEGSGALGYLFEYSTALFWELILSFKIFFKKRFHVIHGCNPPDLIFLTALPFKLFGVKYVFDHHDINPELYIAKFGRKNFFYHCMLWLEKLTFKTANYSIATNESYKQIAIGRGKMSPDKVQVVRSGPSLERIRLTPGNIKYKRGRSFLVGYVGVIGVQEGLDLLLESVKHLISKRQDVHFAIVGGGTSLEDIKKMTIEMGLSEYVDFYGRVSDEKLLDVLNTCDVCVNPDKPTEMNNLSTMNKIMEYMALKKPIVQYDLKEGKASAQNASLYANNNDTKDFAEKIIWLLDHEKESLEMAEYGYNRVLNKLSWEHESVKLINFYAKVLNVELNESAKKLNYS
ncbi:glycosyltransferase family 4 protein [Catalinimonas niigatensis]|uniref:glycosyltransferase family 4 protein n=1 Tax=Catalinimonas niigatensis TaxID=1397264 RepID=UPI002666FC33|nr:glycosyltransferase family 4 protein [Catalinimonas niigatensis]WPP50560.1 glycosyltransferase family 4 protein [Catalinimonas niigatensis]